MEKIGFFKSSLELIKSRKEVVFGVTWVTTLATIITGKGFPSLTKSFLSIIAVMMLNLSVYIYNDITDRKMDAHSNKEKKKRRPIANSKVSVTYAKIFVMTTGLIGFGLCYMISALAFIIGVSYSAILYLYSYPHVRFKTIFILKNIVNSLVLPIGFLIGGVTIQNTLSTTLLFLSLTYFTLIFFILPAVTDWLDYEDNEAFNVKTIGGVLSWRQNVYLFNFGIVIIIAGAVVSHFLFNMNYLTPILMAEIGLPVMIYTLGLARESRFTASYKLRPVGYAFLFLNPLIMTLGALF